MKLVAGLITKNELGRYLKPCVASLLEFCDEIRVLDDGSTDGTFEWLSETDGVSVTPNLGPAFFEHEGRARQTLLKWTLEAAPTHVLAIDADEFVDDGRAVRDALVRDPREEAFGICMVEVWEAEAERLVTRQDGGWEEHLVTAIYRVPPRIPPNWAIADRQLACGRIPAGLRGRGCVDAAILHFGWANVAERVARAERYFVKDGGKFHASAHLESILWPRERLRFRWRPWPEGLDATAILEGTGRGSSEPVASGG